MTEKSPEQLEAEEILRWKNYINMCAMRLMKKIGVIKTYEEYVTKGFAEAIHMVLNGEIRIASEEEVDQMVQEYKQLNGAS